VFAGLDPVVLARAQFAFTISFHFIFPAFSIGLASYLFVLEGLWLKMGPAVTIRDAAAPEESLSFLLAGAIVIIPLILAYTAWAYWVFRGKVGTHGYH